MNFRYSLGESVRAGWALLLTKIGFSGARLVRRPVYFRGRQFASIEPGLTTGYACRFDVGGESPAGKTLFIGGNCRIGDNVHIVASRSVVIGDNCLMASKVFISDTSHGAYSGAGQAHPATVPHERELVFQPVRVGHNVWIGENACVLPGVSLGDGCIVNANAVVTKSFPANVILAGVPARAIKQWDDVACEWRSLGS